MIDMPKLIQLVANVPNEDTPEVIRYSKIIANVPEIIATKDILLITIHATRKLLRALAYKDMSSEDVKLVAAFGVVHTNFLLEQAIKEPSKTGKKKMLYAELSSASFKISEKDAANVTQLEKFATQIAPLEDAIPSDIELAFKLLAVGVSYCDEGPEAMLPHLLAAVVVLKKFQTTNDNLFSVATSANDR